MPLYLTQSVTVAAETAIRGRPVFRRRNSTLIEQLTACRTVMTCSGLNHEVAPIRDAGSHFG